MQTSVRTAPQTTQFSTKTARINPAATANSTGVRKGWVISS